MEPIIFVFDATSWILLDGYRITNRSEELIRPNTNSNII